MNERKNLKRNIDLTLWGYMCWHWVKNLVALSSYIKFTVYICINNNALFSYHDVRFIVQAWTRDVNREVAGSRPYGGPFSYGIRHVFIVIQWTRVTVQWITMNTCRIPYEKARRTGVRNLCNVLEKTLNSWWYIDRDTLTTCLGD